jgi:hypothetical protein
LQGQLSDSGVMWTDVLRATLAPNVTTVIGH